MSKVVTEIKPTRSLSLFKKTVTIHAFGRGTGDWKIGDFTQPENFKRVVEVARQFDVQKVWCPQVGSFNAQIAEPWQFEPDEFEPNRSFEINGVRIMTRVKASGCPVGNGEAFFLASADCPIMVVKDVAGEVVCAHAGRDELIERTWVLRGRAAYHRKFESVVDAVASHFGHPMRYSDIFSGFGIRYDFCHDPANEKYAEYNSKLHDHIRKRCGSEINCFDREHNLRLELLIKQQWLRYGVEHWKMTSDETCTKTDIDEDDQFIWHSRSRDGDASGRNGIFVIRH